MFPPNESLSNLVNFESLYGTKNPFLLLSDNRFIQFPKASKLLLILAPSCSLMPIK